MENEVKEQKIDLYLETNMAIRNVQNGLAQLTQLAELMIKEISKNNKEAEPVEETVVDAE